MYINYILVQCSYIISISCFLSLVDAMHVSFLMQLACNSFEFVKQQASKVCEQPTTCSHQDQKVARLESGHCALDLFIWGPYGEVERRVSLNLNKLEITLVEHVTHGPWNGACCRILSHLCSSMKAAGVFDSPGILHQLNRCQ